MTQRVNGRHRSGADATTRSERATSPGAASERLFRVDRDGLVAVPAGAARNDGDRGDATLPAPEPEETLVRWLARATDPAGSGQAALLLPVVLLVQRDPAGSALQVVARRLGLGGIAGAGAPRAPLRRRLLGFKRRRMFLFDPALVLAFELRAGLVHATLDDGESYVTNYSIRELSARLAARHFFRVHRDVLVNLTRVKEIERMGQGRLRLLLDTSDARGFTASRPASARLRRLLRF